MGESNPSRGVNYIATGRKYIGEACRSAQTVKTHMSSVPITLFADEAPQSNCFDRVQIIEDPHFSFLDKISCMKRSPYPDTLFLDTDTYICADFSELFSLLDRFDIAAAHAPARGHDPGNAVPDSFARMNTGVILFRRSPRVERFLSQWLSLYQRDLKEAVPPDGFDEPAFREALYRSDLRVATLPPEYNCRFPVPGYVMGQVKILHGRDRDLVRIAKRMNSHLGRRVYVRSNYKRIWNRVKRKTRRGVIDALKRREDVVYL